MKTTVELNTANFETEVLKSNLPVLVDFWSAWCGPCNMIAPALEEIAAEQAGKTVIAKVNIDDSPELAARFGITAIPPLIIFKNGPPVRPLRGVQSRRDLNTALATAQSN